MRSQHLWQIQAPQIERENRARGSSPQTEHLEDWRKELKGCVHLLLVWKSHLNWDILFFRTVGRTPRPMCCPAQWPKSMGQVTKIQKQLNNSENLRTLHACVRTTTVSNTPIRCLLVRLKLGWFKMSYTYGRGRGQNSWECARSIYLFSLALFSCDITALPNPSHPGPVQRAPALRNGAG